MDSERARSVLITGASSGIGRACALHMDRLGWQVFAGVRWKKDADSLRRAASARLTPIFLDVTKAAQVRGAVKLVDQASGASGLSGLVNNAAVPYGGPIEFLDLDQLRQAFEVNFFGVVAVTQALIPLLRRGSGRVVNITSISGLVASPFISPYSTSKFSVEAFSDALRVELHPWSIRVAVIEPGAIDTPIWDKAVAVSRTIARGLRPAGLKLYGKAFDTVREGFAPHGIPPEATARAVAHALTSPHPHTRYRVGPDAFVVGFFRFLPDRVRDWYFLSRLRRWG